ncbi:MAG: DUF342 domain-containing protein [Leptospiraceae bacterium]|nr:DUF342 domain-containing protein [Leptospiraceae bacterium]
MEINYFIHPVEDRPFHFSFDNMEETILIPEPGNLVFPADWLAASSENKFPEKQILLKKNETNLNYDDKTVYYDSHNHIWKAKIFGYAGLINKRLTVISPVIISTDKTAAWLYSAEFPDDKFPSIEMIRAVIHANQFMDVITEQELQEEVAKAKSRHTDRIQIARGRPAQNGWPEYVRLVHEKQINSGKIKEDGRMDFREREMFLNVKKSQQIGILVKAQNKSDGYTVYGNTIQAVFSTRGPKMGKNLTLDKQYENVVLAEIDGVLVETNSIVYVDETLYIKSDLDLNIGNIRFNGNVEISGSVPPGFIVEAGGSLRILGLAERSHLSAGGNLIVIGGIIGKPAIKIKSGGRIETLYLRNVNISAAEDILVRDSIYQSNIECGGKIICKQESGQIIGGHLKAKEKIECRIAGSASGVPTILEVGFDPVFEQELNAFEKEIDETKEKRRKAIEYLTKMFGRKFLQNPKHYLEVYQGQEKQTGVQILKLIAALNQKVKNFEANKLSLQRRGPVFSAKPEIIIQKTAYPGVEKRSKVDPESAYIKVHKDIVE